MLVKKERSFQQRRCLLWLAIAGVVLGAAWAIVFLINKEKHPYSYKLKSSCKGGEGFVLPWPRVEEVMTIAPYIPRPDLEADPNGAVVLTLRGEKRVVGKKIFLACRNEREIAFSKEETEFWLEFQGETCTLHQNIMGHGQKQVFLPQAKPSIEVSGLKAYEPDLVVSTYGGSQFDGIKGAYRLVTANHTYFVSAGDRLSWVNDHWEELDNTTPYPLFLVQSIDSKGCSGMVWDVEGLTGRRLLIPITRVSPLHSKVQEVLGKMLVRSDTSVVAKGQGRNTIFRVGDWLLLSGGSVKKLHTADEVRLFCDML